MLLAGGLRALAEAAVVCRHVAPLLAASTASAGGGLARRGSCVMMTAPLLGGAASPLQPAAAATAAAAPCGWQLPRWASSLARTGGAQAPQAPAQRALQPVLRGADDEALSPHPVTTGGSPLTVRYPFPIDYYKDREAVVYTLGEQPAGLAALPGAAFNVPVRVDILHRVARYWRAKWQQGTHKAKTRAEVRGGGRKPWPQKKTGRARQGSIRSPLWKGGGATFGPRPRSHSHDLPRSTRLLGMRCALSARINEGRFFVVDDFLTIRDPNHSATSTTTAAAAPYTIREYRDLKDRVARLTAGSFGATWLLVDGGPTSPDGGARLRKLLKCSVLMEVLSPEQLTVYHVLRYHRLVVTRSALEALSDALTRPHRIVKPVKHAWWLARRQQLEQAAKELSEAAARA